MSSLRFLDMYPDELPDDFFNEDLREMAAQDPLIIFNDDPVTVNGVVIDTCPLVLLDCEEGMAVGRKYPVPANYIIRNDLKPSTDVMNWYKRRVHEPGLPFPHIKEMEPIIPPSRFDKRRKMSVLEDFFIAHGYDFFNPDKGSYFKPSLAGHIKQLEELDDNKCYVIAKEADEKSVKRWVRWEENIYHPNVVKRIKSVKRVPSGYVVEMVHKDSSYFVDFRFDAKRVHSDVWIPSFFEDPSKDHYSLAEFDLIFSDETEFYKLIKKVKQNSVVYEPFFVDPYVLRQDARCGEGFSRLRDRDTNYPMLLDGQEVYLPWSSASFPYRASSDRMYRRIEGPMLEIRGTSININDAYRQLRRLEREEDLISYMRLYQTLKDVFVVRAPRSLHDGDICRYKQGLSYISVEHMYVLDPGGQYSAVDIDIPIAKSPKNFLGKSLIQMSTLTLLEFVARRDQYLDMMKLPYWEMRATGFAKLDTDIEFKKMKEDDSVVFDSGGGEVED